jgi:hypothetical protein
MGFIGFKLKVCISRISHVFHNSKTNQSLEEKYSIVIDYSVNKQASPSNQKTHTSREWSSLQEGLKYQNEVERKRGIVNFSLHNRLQLFCHAQNVE